MKATLFAVPLLLAAILIPLAGASADDKNKDGLKKSEAKAPTIEAQIDAANRKWVAAYGAGDATALAALYSDQATVLPPGGDLVTGHDNVMKFWQGTIQSGLKITSLRIVAVERHGNVAREIGRFQADAPNGDKPAMHLEGKYVVFWKYIKGAWKLDTDIWNLNK